MKSIEWVGREGGLSLKELLFILEGHKQDRIGIIDLYGRVEDEMLLTKLKMVDEAILYWEWRIEKELIYEK